MHHSPILEIGGLHIDLSAFIMITVTCIIVFILAVAATRNLSVTNPSKLQNFMEWVIEFVRNIIGSAMDLKKGRPFLALGLTLIMFIFVGNMLGLPFAIGTVHHEPLEIIGITEEDIHHAEEEGHGYHVVWWKSPTADASVTLGLAVMVFLICHINGIRRNPRHYLKHYFEPFPVFFPLNIVKQIAKPVTHGMRLYGNIYAGEVLISVLIGAGVFGILPLVVWQGFSIFVGSIQAFIFVVLTMVYISMEMADEEH